MRRPIHDSRTGFIDLLLCAFSTTIVLSILLTLLINPLTKIIQEGVRKNAEYIIQLDWDANIDCDIDLWVKDPNGATSWFNTKEIGLMHLERDDRGLYNDTYTVDGKIHKYMVNSEVLTIRGKIPGKYTINAHLYTCRNNAGAMSYSGHYSVGEPYEISAKMTVTKLNPNLVVLAEEIVSFEKIFQEKTILSVTFNDEGFVSSIDKDFVNIVVAKTTGEIR